ncbi:MAG: HPr family phosphocarrier protein [Simkaniaceae bacterium]|nr:HPr family phosphocarrier protein [Simkaniaceae bacterium]
MRRRYPYIERKLTMIIRVSNEGGLHVRPASRIAAIARESRSRVRIAYESRDADGSSMMDIMLLAVPENGRLRIEVTGRDAEDTLIRLIGAFEKNFAETYDDIT